ncbi:hypothetical protein B0O99DRAFT_633904 [Bisporella sp. PMI_857]|nr:hypothetical protein B0O99DRAFT_633904 [Bisporella sp. PMI_857]
MQFSKLLTVLFLAIPVFAAAGDNSNHGSGTNAPSTQKKVSSAPGGEKKVTVPTREQAMDIARNLKALSEAIEKELKDCIAVPGENTAECFNRQKGMNLPQNAKMSDAEIEKATQKYSQLVGKELAECSKKHGFYPCLKKIQEADDKKAFNFQKRGWGTDFMNGFVKGFTGVLNAAAPIITEVLPYVAKGR